MPHDRLDASARRPRALSRPTVAQIHDYRSRIDDTLLDLVESRLEDTDLAALVELGLNHEEEHQELRLTNLNLLTRLNRELGADFDIDAFEHSAVYDTEKARVDRSDGARGGLLSHALLGG